MSSMSSGATQEDYDVEEKERGFRRNLRKEQKGVHENIILARVDLEVTAHQLTSYSLIYITTSFL